MPLPSSGATSPAMPRTNMMLKMLEPTAFPMARSGVFRNVAIRAVANSGVPVPMETMVRPIRASLSPKILARSTAPDTRKLAPKPNVIMPSEGYGYGHGYIISIELEGYWMLGGGYGYGYG